MKKYFLFVLAIVVSISLVTIGELDSFLLDVVSARINISTAIINNNVEVKNIRFIHSSTNELVTEFSNGHVITMIFEVNNPTAYDVTIDGDLKMAFHTDKMIVNNTFFIYEDNYSVDDVRYYVLNKMGENALLGFTGVEDIHMTNTSVGERLGTKTKIITANQIPAHSSTTFAYKVFYAGNHYVQGTLLPAGLIPMEFIVDIQVIVDNQEQEIQNTSSYSILNTLALTHSNPTIELNGDAEIILCLDEPFTDPGARAWNSFGREISSIANITVNTSQPGTYIITYTAIDVYGWSSSIDRKVTVLDTACEIPD